MTVSTSRSFPSEIKKQSSDSLLEGITESHGCCRLEEYLTDVISQDNWWKSGSDSETPGPGPCLSPSAERRKGRDRSKSPLRTDSSSSLSMSRSSSSCSLNSFSDSLMEFEIKLEGLCVIFPNFPPAMMKCLLIRYDRDESAVMADLVSKGWEMNYIQKLKYDSKLKSERDPHFTTSYFFGRFDSCLKHVVMSAPVGSYITCYVPTNSDFRSRHDLPPGYYLITNQFHVCKMKKLRFEEPQVDLQDPMLCHYDLLLPLPRPPDFPVENLFPAQFEVSPPSSTDSSPSTTPRSPLSSPGRKISGPSRRTKGSAAVPAMLGGEGSSYPSSSHSSSKKSASMSAIYGSGGGGQFSTLASPQGGRRSSSTNLFSSSSSSSFFSSSSTSSSSSAGSASELDPALTSLDGFSKGGTSLRSILSSTLFKNSR